MFTALHDPDMTLASIPSRTIRPPRFWQHPLLAPLTHPQAWDRLVAVVNPAWSLTEPRARVLRIEDEARDVRSLWLAPNARFRGFVPGQHVLLELEINGARHARCFSLSHAPRTDGLLRLTIKRKDDGPVSNAAHALKSGQIVRLSQAQGHFAPRNTSARLLLLSAGSGVTPMMSILHGLASTDPRRDVVLLQTERDAADAIFAQELQSLMPALRGLRAFHHVTAASGRLTADQITQVVPDWVERETLLCGPDGFMRMVENMYANAGRSQQLQSESFGRHAAPVDPDAAEHAISHGQPEQVFTVQAGQNLLDGAEAAGLRPRFGCRRGICRTCQCVKRRGTVTNLLTGQRSGPGEELIQLCISTPQSALELVL